MNIEPHPINIEKIREPRYTDAIERYLKNDPHYKYIEQLFQTLDNHETKYYLWGGAVRNPITEQIHDRYIPTSDIDILIDDSEKDINIEELLKDLDGKILTTSLGSPRWKPEEILQIDIVKLSHATKLKHDPNLPVSLETTLKSCEFTPSAIAYNPKEKAIYSYGAIEAIEKQEFELLYTKDLHPEALMCNLILKSEKTGFYIGPKAKTLISEKYNPDLNQKIKEYMTHKGTEDKTDYVIDRLQEIQNQAKNNKHTF